MTEPSTGSRHDAPRELFPSIVDEMRVLIVAGVIYGAVVAGLGSRVAMLLLRITSPDSVNGVQSDDGFTIGTFTIGGTYNLLVIGALAGILGAGAYRLVRPWLIGPMWFRRLTTGLASGAVVGSMLVHADGVDFRVLEPTWFAIGLFVILPGLFGTFIGPVVDRVASDDSWTRHGRRRWALPVVSLLMFPPSIVIVPFVAVLATALLACREIDGVERVRASIPYGLAVRALWLGVALLGLVALLGDIVDVARAV
jgi:hypothetical protein